MGTYIHSSIHRQTNRRPQEDTSPRRRHLVDRRRPSRLGELRIGRSRRRQETPKSPSPGSQDMAELLLHHKTALRNVFEFNAIPNVAVSYRRSSVLLFLNINISLKIWRESSRRFGNFFCVASNTSSYQARYLYFGGGLSPF